MRKLSATALSLYLKSPKAFYWRYVAGLEPVQPSVTFFDHDKLFGTIWAEYVDRFYNGESEEANVEQTHERWLSSTEGWVPEKARDAKTKALESLMPLYYQQFRPDDGCRAPNKSELWLENDRFVSKLDGLSAEGIVHEVKTASRCPSLAEQLWKVQNSLQVRLYCVLAQAVGHRIEFAYKDPPYQIYRGPIVFVTESQRQQWELELNTLADQIYSLGDNPNHYPCHPDSCCLITKGVVSMCQFQILCDQGVGEFVDTFFRKRTLN